MIMPKMGESIMEATILSWLKKEGDRIEQDESVLEVATDKVDTEVPATHGGILKKILAHNGDVVAVGKPIAVITTDIEQGEDGNAREPVSTLKQPEKEKEKDMEAQEVSSPAASAPMQISGNGTPSIKPMVAGRFYSPLVRNIAKQEAIAIEELETVPGTGKEGRVTKADILSYLKTRTDPKIHAPAAASVMEAPLATSAPSVSGEDEIIEMDRMRKMIAERMVESKRIAPHVTSFVEADVTDVVNWRNRVKKDFEQREGEKITFTPIFIEAIVKAIKDFPMINISVDGDNIIRHKQINIGVAVALPNGNLIVPVIKGADDLSLSGLTKRVNDMAQRARNNKLSPDELTGGTYTVSNVGSFGNLMGTPIIMQPQVAIMAVGAIRKKPSVVETPEGDFIGIRHKMFLSHSYDHRVVDGSLGGMFVRKVADYLENFDTHQNI